LASLAPEQLDGLYRALNDPDIANRSAELQSARVEQDLKIDFQEAYEYLQVMPFLIGLKNEAGANDDDLFRAITESIRRASEGKLPDAFEAKTEVLRRLFGPKPDAALSRKRRRLVRGPVKKMRRIEGVCDIRPLFDLERTRILELLQVAIVRLTLEDDDSKEDVVVLQMDDDSLQAMEDFLAITRRKFRIIREQLNLPAYSNHARSKE
jgi:hypothetical protein